MPEQSNRPSLKLAPEPAENQQKQPLTDGIVTIQVLSGEGSVVACLITNMICCLACHIRQVSSKPANHIVSL